MTLKKIAVEDYFESELSGIVTEDDTHITINIPGVWAYDISRLSCQTAEQVLGWASHLAEKQWMTMEALRRFIIIASHNAGIDL
ncbi:hypothetical protein EXB91_24800 [Salmonella enterica subsp. enterica serovar Florida]|uniref:Uncharacterized protein n=3 Tax=Salmonella enterica I TaxID=59201 RepID=A0A5U8JJA8_SALET|nr:hypothetical protein [Salmonella enterica]EAW1318451.1 hypothetical protein [Salmonella enterica subsp. diarizonae]EBR7996911.1 hypothetical protein [Salmonella enterica subsp. enterica serovar Panama]EBS4088756.1 hypothetical protein [Salmonella enterica subsp. enterica serovar Newport]ECG3786845.1 hypothetical protein [Salmonella enterica subsp. enterica serovar Florida]ASD87222.1 hypothetical protein LFZ16_13840 [Salmonella enterica subsp. enterica serovar India str. SA20085604]